MNRSPDEVTIRFATRADQPGLRRLAELDSARPPTGTTLVAEVDGEVVAGLPVGGGPPLADPFRPTGGLVRLLRLREAQLRGRRRMNRRGRSAPRIQAARPAATRFPDRR